MERKNVLIGKIGKSVKLRGISIAKGDDTCIILFSTIARMFPEYDFYFCGPNDLKNLSPEEYEYIFPNKNVMSIFGRDDSVDDIYHPITDAIRDRGLKFDFALMFCGYVSNINVPNFVPRKSGNKAKILNAFLSYAGPYIYTLNETMVPVYTISEDPRYVTIAGEDFYNRERRIFTQMDVDIRTHAHITSKEDFTYVSEVLHGEYAEVEKIFLMAIDPDWRSKVDIQRKLASPVSKHCISICNGHGTAKIDNPGSRKGQRLPTCREWIIDNLRGTPYEGTMVYGSWDPEIHEQYPMIQDRKLIDLTDEIADAKYTLVYSIIPGFVTIKPFEMIVKGIIPFLHPDYDKNHLLKLPEYLYVKDKQDFVNKMMELDADPDKYLKVLNECFDMIKPEHMDGSLVVNRIMSSISQDLYGHYEPRPGVEPIFNHFNKSICNFHREDDK